jgi:hypothetical protein
MAILSADKNNFVTFFTAFRLRGYQGKPRVAYLPAFASCGR